MDVELLKNPDELFRILSDQIEDINRTLYDDENFCNKDLNATYQTAVKYVQNIQIKFGDKLNELKTKIDRLREENLNVSKENKKQFNDEIEEINQIFLSGKYQQALEKFHQYKTRFDQRTIIINKIPKLYMKEIDINQYFSIGQPTITPQISLNSNKEYSSYCSQSSNIDPFIHEDDEETTDHKSTNHCFNVQYKHSTSEQISSNNQSTYKQRQLSVPTPSSQKFRLSTRISTTSNSIQNVSTKSNRNSSEQINSQSSQVSIIKTNESDGLLPIHIAPYRHESNTLMTMICDQKCIILLRSQSDRLQRWCSIFYDRSNPIHTNQIWHNFAFKSLGFFDQKHIYIFTDREFLIYSIDFSSKLYSCLLLNNQNYHNHYDKIHLGYGGTVYKDYIYYIYQNLDEHWILSVLRRDTIEHLSDHNLTMIFPRLIRVIQLLVNAQLINILIETDIRQYAVLSCSNDLSSEIQLKNVIILFYPVNPVSICSIGKDIYLINDPSGKVLHLITSEKYLRSYQLFSYCLYYNEHNEEIVFVNHDGIYSIDVNEFFSKFNRN